MIKINIAIDGFSSCGKGTLAKYLAQQLGYQFIDSGAMYRGITLRVLDSQVDINDHEAITAMAAELQFEFKINHGNGRFELYLNEENVEGKIRNLHVSNSVSEVAAISGVRRQLVLAQQAIGQNKGVVMDGRDIGTVVFPDAELKIFMTAKPEVRAFRRFEELNSAGHLVNMDEVLANLKKRDHIDTHREDSPLYLADDYKVLDNSDLTREEQNSIAMRWVRETLKNS
jgi:cytidylate kinase